MASSPWSSVSSSMSSTSHARSAPLILDFPEADWPPIPAPPARARAPAPAAARIAAPRTTAPALGAASSARGAVVAAAATTSGGGAASAIVPKPTGNRANPLPGSYHGSSSSTVTGYEGFETASDPRSTMMPASTPPRSDGSAPSAPSATPPNSTAALAAATGAPTSPSSASLASSLSATFAGLATTFAPAHVSFPMASSPAAPSISAPAAATGDCATALRVASSTTAPMTTPPVRHADFALTPGMPASCFSSVKSTPPRPDRSAAFSGSTLVSTASSAAASSSTTPSCFPSPSTSFAGIDTGSEIARVAASTTTAASPSDARLVASSTSPNPAVCDTFDLIDHSLGEPASGAVQRQALAMALPAGTEQRAQSPHLSFLSRGFPGDVPVFSVDSQFLFDRGHGAPRRPALATDINGTGGRPTRFVLPAEDVRRGWNMLLEAWAERDRLNIENHRLRGEVVETTLQLQQSRRTINDLRSKVKSHAEEFHAQPQEQPSGEPCWDCRFRRGIIPSISCCHIRLCPSCYVYRQVCPSCGVECVPLR